MFNKKVIYIGFFTIIIAVWVLIFGYYYWGDKKFSTEKIQDDQQDAIFQEESLSKEEKLAQFKRRMNFRSILRKWDFYSIKNMKETALQYYLNAYKRLPNDTVLEKKIWDTYFEMKNYEKAYEYYKKIPSGDIDLKLKDKMLRALLYTWNKNMRDEFNQIIAPKDMKDYYDKVLVCYTWISNCLSEIRTYSWSVDKIKWIQKNMVDYSNVTDSDPNSKYAALAWDFFKNKDYLAAALVSQETLSKRSNYTSVLKIAWFSWYELWDYKKANDYLQKYYAIEPKDVTVTYLLWIINFYTENYISSNLYFNAAVLNWYRPKTELQKRLAYNYYIIGDKKNMLKVFRYILDEEDTTQDDYSVALFTAIEEKEYSKAMLWANKWATRFPQADMIFAFRWWLYNIRKDESSAIKNLQTSIWMNPRNAVALFNMWLITQDRNNFPDAKKYFQSVIEADKNWTFWEKAEEQLKDMPRKMNELLSQSWATAANPQQ
ncbi:MAG: hypothetical protein ACD_2C00218G0001 [uncultured bacterium (gcode 4)]|uniref:Tetratricopeptide repeat protein n=1 Tax=uncultured bacterium (gcode 4) TaxID=1234023 RepID=K2G4C7_9BACT|nr:MAG: hypothetical protein ACD_2C00218G0001 [uncultured bacterium (gcode 4)]